ncbi:conserved Plasmodium protein, unknown function [Plasmodium ovale wallikeri]|uniref:Uncharacterized protein n=2 Tax=Plasmodium ovale TaxID=36330 RepID=A0A1A8ZBM2_PLAOA|nr:conserved Plasmodium protein, unknown function [Plasmodium ovale wallikeri]SBT41375.1 conserved Plasmodium protein, unknown function [Plasmodium ovale wallikeri]SBT73563.1 conserved Plasmodium protein, unknown function [Plasmodium ovale]
MTKASYPCMLKLISLLFLFVVIDCMNNQKYFHFANFVNHKKVKGNKKKRAWGSNPLGSCVGSCVDNCTYKCGHNRLKTRGRAVSEGYSYVSCERRTFPRLYGKRRDVYWKGKSKWEIGARKIDQKEIKRKKNYHYAMKHMFDKNGRRIKEINKERKSLKKKKLFDYEGFKVDEIFTCLPEEDMEELREEELKRKSGEILHNNKYIDTYGVESDADLGEI